MYNYEEKYKAAIKRAAKLRDDLLKNGTLATAKGVESIFPELAELEDERMVKFIKKQLFNIKKTITENYELDAKLTKAIDWLEKQGEQKHIPWYDIEKSKEAGYTIVPNEEYDRLTKPAEWSEEDEDYYDAIIAKLEVTQDDALLTDNQMKFLKSIKDRVQSQPKQEWSEEDEKILKELTKFIPYHLTAHSYNQYYNWAISHRPQPHWKPSDEQMNALNDVISSRDIKYDVLSELWKELKNLKD